MSAQFISRGGPKPSRPRGLAGLVIPLLASSLYIPVAYASCRLEEIAEFHVDMVGDSPIIDGQVNGQPIRILLETGSPLSYITRTAALQLGLPIRSYKDRTIMGVNGRETIHTAVVKQFKMGPLALENYTANVVGTAIDDANGVSVFQLGSDLLTHFTTEWDLAHGVVRFLHPQDCTLEQLVYWSPNYFQVNLDSVSTVNPSLLLEVKLNGRPMKAKLVSGSANSKIRTQAARDAGVEPGGPDAAPEGEIEGLRREPIPTWIGRFDTFEVGGEKIMNARLLISDDFPTGKVDTPGYAVKKQFRSPVDIDLGADFLQANHIIFVPEKHAALFTYNGGDVFNLKHHDDAESGVSK